MCVAYFYHYYQIYFQISRSLAPSGVRQALVIDVTQATPLFKIHISAISYKHKAYF